MWFWIVSLAAAFSITKFSIISFLCCLVSNKEKMPCDIQRAYRCEDGKRQSRDAVACPQCALLLLHLLQVPVLWTRWPEFTMGANGLWCVRVTEVGWLLLVLRSASSTCSLLLFPWELCVRVGRGQHGNWAVPWDMLPPPTEQSLSSRTFPHPHQNSEFLLGLGAPALGKTVSREGEPRKGSAAVQPEWRK